MKQNERLFDEVNINNISEKEFRVINALDVSIHRSLSKYEMIFQIIDQRKDNMNSALVLLCWELVDWFERTRKILGYGAGLKKKEPSYILAFRALEEAEDFRNMLQHFDNFLHDSIENDLAPLGSVTAFNYLGIKDGYENIEFLSYNAGVIRGENVNLGAGKIPGKMVDKVDFVTLHLNDKEVNLSNIARKLLNYYSILKTKLKNKYPIE